MTAIDEIRPHDDYSRIEILAESSAAQSSRIEELANDPSLRIIDKLDAVVAELDDVSSAEIDPHWVVFPWRHTAVRLPGPKIFRRLRTDRNRNKLTTSEQQRLGSATIGVVGLSVGHSIAYTLAAEGIGRTLRLADGDHLELTNMNRIPASVADIGENKAVLAARRIVELDPYIDVSVHPQALTTESLDAFVVGLDLLIEECDSLDIKIALRESAKRHRVPVVMHTSDNGLLDVERFDLEPDRPLLHDLIGSISTAEIEGLATDEKVPYVLRILDPEHISSRLAASLIEIDHQVTTWPQLAEDVVLGAASVTAIARRLLLDEPVPSGRSRLEIDTDPLPISRRSEDPRSGNELGLEVEESDQTGGPHSPEGPFHLQLAWAAGRAPSGGNVQPWLFRAAENRFDIELDPSKSTSMDIAWRGSQVAVGASALNAEIAASARSRLADVSIEGEGPTTAVRLALKNGRSHDYDRLYDYIAKRTTDRSRGPTSELPDEFRVQTHLWAGRFGAGAHVVTARSTLDELGTLLGEADRLRYLDLRLHGEMFSELKWPGDDDSTGIDVRSLALSPTDAAALDVLRRRDVVAELGAWKGGRALTEIAQGLLADSSGALVVYAGTSGGHPFVNAGRALQAMWLEATRLGIGVHPISPLFLYATSMRDCLQLVDVDDVDEVWELAQQFRRLLGLGPNDQPALIARLTHPTGRPTPTKRIEPGELLVEIPL